MWFIIHDKVSDLCQEDKSINPYGSTILRHSLVTIINLSWSDAETQVMFCRQQSCGLIFEQECIPVGCVPAAHWPYAAVFFPRTGGGGVCSRGGVCSGGCLLWGDVCSGGSALGGVCLGGSARGGLLWGGGCIPACTEADTPPVDRILDTRLWKYYLGPTSLRPVIKVQYLVRYLFV